MTTWYVGWKHHQAAHPVSTYCPECGDHHSCPGKPQEYWQFKVKAPRWFDARTEVYRMFRAGGIEPPSSVRIRPVWQVEAEAVLLAGFVGLGAYMLGNYVSSKKKEAA